VPLQRRRAVVGVDVECELTQTGDVGFDDLAAQCDHETVVAVCSERGGHGVRYRVDGGHVGGDVLNSRRVEHIAQRNAARRQVGLVVADPNVVVGLRAEHCDFHTAMRDAELVESPGRTQGRPQARETRAEHDDLAHWTITSFR
jgi:hypothetical protein